MAKLLEKIIFIHPVQVCRIGKSLVFFKLLDTGKWEQYVALDNKPAYALPDERPLVYFADAFLDSHNKSVRLKRQKRGIYIPLEDSG